VVRHPSKALCRPRHWDFANLSRGALRSKNLAKQKHIGEQRPQMHRRVQVIEFPAATVGSGRLGRDRNRPGDDTRSLDAAQNGQAPARNQKKRRSDDVTVP
jgi:hypothetical protein